MNHGHVKPNPNGMKVRCGGPGICAQCSAEAVAHARTLAGESKPTNPSQISTSDEEFAKSIADRYKNAGANIEEIQVAFVCVLHGIVHARAESQAEIDRLREALEICKFISNAMKPNVRCIGLEKCHVDFNCVACAIDELFRKASAALKGRE